MGHNCSQVKERMNTDSPPPVSLATASPLCPFPTPMDCHLYSGLVCYEFTLMYRLLYVNILSTIFSTAFILFY